MSLHSCTELAVVLISTVAVCCRGHPKIRPADPQRPFPRDHITEQNKHIAVPGNSHLPPPNLSETKDGDMG